MDYVRLDPDMFAAPKGKFVTASNEFPGHAGRLARQEARINGHTCQRLGGRSKCGDCLWGWTVWEFPKVIKS
jgi:hypothetical protein